MFQVQLNFFEIVPFYLFVIECDVMMTFRLRIGLIFQKCFPHISTNLNKSSLYSLGSFSKLNSTLFHFLLWVSFRLMFRVFMITSVRIYRFPKLIIFRLFYFRKQIVVAAYQRWIDCFSFHVRRKFSKLWQEILLYLNFGISGLLFILFRDSVF